VDPRSDRMLIRRVERGDVVVIPEGVAFWWYNDGFGAHKIFSASDTTGAMPPGEYHVLVLIYRTQIISTCHRWLLLSNL
jgi:hypothetical protein